MSSPNEGTESAPDTQVNVNVDTPAQSEQPEQSGQGEQAAEGGDTGGGE